ncbi:MAG: hypothetical protein U0228_17700 [Myxococcaceae bacterium]
MSDLLITAFGGKVFGVDRHTGAIAWRFAFSEYNGSTVELFFPTPDRVLAVTSNYLGVLERATGAVIKQLERKDKAANHRPVAILDGRQLIIGSQGTLACYSLDLELQWDQQFKGEGTAPTALGFPGNVRQADDRGAK